jgi:hypothetical protein
MCVVIHRVVRYIVIIIVIVVLQLQLIGGGPCRDQDPSEVPRCPSEETDGRKDRRRRRRRDLCKPSGRIGLMKSSRIRRRLDDD